MHGEDEWKFQNEWVNVKCTHFLNEYAKKYFSNNKMQWLRMNAWL